MGYYVDMEISDVVIPADKIEGCLKAINEMFEAESLSRGGGGTYSGGAKTSTSYSWVNSPDGGFKDLGSALNEWRYDSEIVDGDCRLSYFHGEKLGDDGLLMDAIAPFVKSGGTIDCRGEDGALWRWEFDGEKAKELWGKVIYE